MSARRLALYLVHVMHVTSTEIQLVLLCVQVRMNTAEGRVNDILTGELVAHVKGCVAILIAGKHGMRIMEKVGGRVGSA